ncbi:MAG: ATP-binding protein [Bdellovibrionota bacterium]
MKALFEQQTSFIERLRIILLIIAAFFILGIMGLYFSSRGFLSGLQDISRTNQILNFTSTSLQALSASEENLEKLTAKSTSQSLIPFHEASRISLQNIFEASRISGHLPGIRSKLTEAEQAVLHYQSAVESIVGRNDLNFETLRSEVLVAKQFVMDAEEGLRETQILLKNESDDIFNDIYNNRFDPLIVASFLSLVFFAFVVIVGLSSAKRLGLSLSNLTKATDAVSEGDLNYIAPILESDEFGKLTFEFNSMVQSLQDKQLKLTEAMEKVTRLQTITNSFSGALLPGEVFDVIVMDVYKALKADIGTLSLLNEEGNLLNNRLIGFSQEHEVQFASLSMNAVSPMVTLVKTGEPRFIEDVEILKADYPNGYNNLMNLRVQSTAYLPLIVGDQIYGGLNFGFREKRTFSGEDEEFMMALTRQCAQALHRARLYKSATDAIQVRDEFLSIASHELRTPLTPLKLQLQNMSRQVRKGQIQIEKPEQVLRVIDSSDRQVDRLITLIDDLLDVSRISAGKLSLNIEVFDFGAMVVDVITHYTSQTKDLQDLVQVEIEKNIYCSADRVRMEQVVINFLTNAVKYAPGKPIKVKVSRYGMNVRLEVEDEGEGISSENQSRIFGRFERVRDKNNIGGLGLGLYICRQIVEAHGGEISVKSATGKGSTFIVEIPAIS